MRHILVLTPLLILLICGSACTVPSTEAPTPKIIPVSPENKPEFDAAMKAKLEAARYELQLYEEELGATEKEIRNAEARSGKQEVRDGRIFIWKRPSDSLLARRNELKEKVIQVKVKVRELETLLNEKHAKP
jgi:hypothetical protein